MMPRNFGLLGVARDAPSCCRQTASDVEDAVSVGTVLVQLAG